MKNKVYEMNITRATHSCMEGYLKSDKSTLIRLFNIKSFRKLSLNQEKRH